MIINLLAESLYYLNPIILIFSYYFINFTYEAVPALRCALQIKEVSHYLKAIDGYDNRNMQKFRNVTSIDACRIMGISLQCNNNGVS